MSREKKPFVVQLAEQRVLLTRTSAQEVAASNKHARGAHGPDSGSRARALAKQLRGSGGREAGRGAHLAPTVSSYHVGPGPRFPRAAGRRSTEGAR